MKKIISKKINNNKYYIELYIDDILICSDVAVNILQRDSIIFDWCELHDVIDIEHINTMNKDIDEIDNTIPIIPYTDTFQLEDYFDSNSDVIFSRIIEAISEGIITKKKKIKLFQIDDSGIFIDSLKRDWPEGLRTAHKYFLSNEQYDKCSKCLELLKKLKSAL